MTKIRCIFRQHLLENKQTEQPSAVNRSFVMFVVREVSRQGTLSGKCASMVTVSPAHHAGCAFNAYAVHLTRNANATHANVRE